MKKIFFLSFFLIPITTYCMEVKEVNLSKMKPIERQDFLDYNNHSFMDTNYIGIPYFYENHHEDFVKLHEKELKKINFHGYSALGIAAIAIKVYSLPDKNKENFDEAPYNEKKAFIQKLLECGFKPTQKDRELALQVELEADIIHSNNKSDLLGE